MLEILLIAGAFVVFSLSLVRIEAGSGAAAIAPRKVSAKLTQLAEYADRLYAERKWVAAEKAYLQVLKIDHKHLGAYSHLGIIYSTQKNMADAIECFQIATRIHPSAVTYQNLGLAYFDNRNFVKSIAAYEKSIMFEPSVLRYLGLSKAQQKLANSAGVIAALERAVELEASPKTLGPLAVAYRSAGQTDQATQTDHRLKELEQAKAA